MIKKVIAAVAVTSGLVLAGAGVASADAGSMGGTLANEGVANGNVIQVPVNVPVNVCGSSLSVGGAFNSNGGNVCVNT